MRRLLVAGIVLLLASGSAWANGRGGGGGGGHAGSASSGHVGNVSNNVCATTTCWQSHPHR